MTETKDLTVIRETLPQDNRRGLFLDPVAFDHAQRVAMVFTKSTMVPEHFRNNIGNCLIALNYASRVGVDPFMVMQKMYVIHGKPAVETQLQIALFNASGKYTPLKYKLSGEGDKRQCVAFATEKSSGEEIEGPAVSLAMAKAEGWSTKGGSKWKSLPELMLRYRSAAFFIRLYSPETTLGIYTKEEIDDTAHGQPQREADDKENIKPIEVTVVNCAEPIEESKIAEKKTPVKKSNDNPY